MQRKRRERKMHLHLWNLWRASELKAAAAATPGSNIDIALYCIPHILHSTATMLLWTLNSALIPKAIFFSCFPHTHVFYWLKGILHNRHWQCALCWRIVGAGLWVSVIWIVCSINPYIDRRSIKESKQNKRKELPSIFHCFWPSELI